MATRWRGGYQQASGRRNPELTGAAKHAAALHALFADTFGSIEAKLLLDQQATLSSIRFALDDSLALAAEENVVVISFAGHATRGGTPTYLTAWQTPTYFTA
jgi:hypothetical protein